MGGKSGQTIGYWFLDAIHYGFAQSMDALLKIRGDGKDAWKGRVTANATISVNAPDLYGGPQGGGEGGVVTDIDVLFGNADQMPNAYLESVFGAPQTAHRGKASVVIKGGKTGAKSPYPKPLAFLVERILTDWEGGTVWYAAKAPIPIEVTETLYTISPDVVLDANSSSLDGTGTGYEFTVPQGATIVIKLGPSSSAWSYTPSDDYNLGSFPRTWWNCFGLRNLSDSSFTTYWLETYLTAALAHAANSAGEIIVPVSEGGNFRLFLYDATVDDNRGAGSYFVGYRGYSYFAMNPAHMIYDSIVLNRVKGGMGEPVGKINDASFTAAADTLFAEGFGLCTEWKDDETAAQFQDRILDIIAGAFSQGADGQYYLDLIRDLTPAQVAALPIFTETDVLDFDEEPSNINESVNRVIVEWNDPLTDEDRATAPVTSLGAVQALGGVITATITHREIPKETLALRVGGRELGARAKPLKRINLSTNRRHHTLRKGQYFRLQMPSEGIGDMVCLIAEIDRGTLESGRMQFVVSEAVFGMPDTIYVDPAAGLGGGGAAPAAPANQRIFETPYNALARRLSKTDLAALTAETGYLATVAARPGSNAINYGIYSAASGESYTARGTGDWCPSAVIVEAAVLASLLPTAFTFSGGTDMALVEVGNAALWDDEIVRVDAIDIAAGTITLGRGCGDTIPAKHAAGQRIWFYHDDSGTDAREYIDGEDVNAKLLTRTSSGQLPIGAATALPLTFAGRQARPYPQADVRMGGVPVLTVDSTQAAPTAVEITTGGPIPPLNGDFEAGDTGWDLGAGFAIVNDPSVAFEGSWLLRWTGGVASEAPNQQFITIDSPGTFIAQMRARIRMAVATTSAPRPRARLYANKYDGAGVQQSQIQPNSLLLLAGQTDTGWQTIDVFCERVGTEEYFKVAPFADGDADTIIEFELLTWNGLEYIAAAPFPEGLVGFHSEQAGWSVTAGVAKYDPTVSGQADSYLYLNSPIEAPFGSGISLHVATDLNDTSAPYLSGHAASMILAGGAYLGASAIGNYGSHSTVTGYPDPTYGQMAPGVLARTDGVHPVYFFNLAYAVLGP